MITLHELDELNFLRESNNIENEWDDLALQDAIIAWQYIKTQKKLSLDNIQITHRLLMDHRDTLEDKYKGSFRDGPVWIGGKEAKPFYAVPNLLEDWVDTANRGLKLKDGGDHLAHVLHVRYEAIHPFFDGNGRTGRLFLNWQRVKMGLPILIIKEKEKHEYYKWFNQAGLV
jgi:Fic family protein